MSTQVYAAANTGVSMLDSAKESLVSMFHSLGDAIAPIAGVLVVGGIFLYFILNDDK